MADNKISVSAVVREDLVGLPYTPPSPVGVSAVTLEVVSGEPPIPDPPAALALAVREVLVQDNRGTPPYAMQAVRETLSGDGIGLNIPVESAGVTREIVFADSIPEPLSVAGSQVVVREVLLKEPPFKFSSTVRESLVSKVESLTLRHVATGLRQYALTKRPPMVKPSTVISFNTPMVLREIVTQKRVPVRPYSEVAANKLNFQIAMKRSPPPEEYTRSPILVSRITWMGAVSRGKVYVPVSEVVTAALQSQFVMAREFTPAPQVRTAITMPQLVSQIVQSRNGRVVVIMTDAFVHTGVQQVVQKIDVKQYRSSVHAAEVVSLTVQHREVTPPGIDDRVAAVAQSVMVRRDTIMVKGSAVANSIRSIAVQRRNAARPAFSSGTVLNLKSLVLTRLDVPAPGNVTGRHVKKLMRQSVHARAAVLPPNTYRSANIVKALVLESVQEIRPPMHRSITRVGSLTLAWTLGKKFPLPWDVIDPAIGRHVANMNVLALQHRETTPPETISKESRYAHSVLEHVVFGEQFPPPDMPEPVVPETFVSQVGQVVVQRDESDWGAVSAISTRGVSESLVVGDADDWIDATIPMSDVSASAVLQSLAVFDQFLDPATPQSEISTAALTEAVALADTTMPDPMFPQSEIEVVLAVESAALGDVNWPDPTIPVSDLFVRRVAAISAVRDPSLIGEVGGSDAEVQSVLEIVILPDRSLVGIPLRKGPRPQVSVSVT